MRTKEEIIKEIYHSIGQASVCWSTLPSGQFDEKEATKVSENLLAKVEEYADEFATAFSQWTALRFGYQLSGKWMDMDSPALKEYTTTELIEIFKQEKGIL